MRKGTLIKGALPWMKMCMVILSVTSLFSLSAATAQDCQGQFRVNAGPGIDVCDGGQVNLGGMIGGDATISKWLGGKGNFEPGRDVTDAHYSPDASEAGTTVILTLRASNPSMPECPPQDDMIKIVVNEEVKADAGKDQRICGNQPVQLHGIVTSGKAKETNWITNGSGSFDNLKNPEAVYNPSDDDVKKGGCSLVFEARPFGQCQPDSDEVILVLDPVPLIAIDDEKYAEAGEAISLLATTNTEQPAFNWRTHGTGSFTNTVSAGSVYTPSAEDIKKGMVILIVILTSPQMKCSAEKNITLHIDAQNKKR